MDFVEPTDCKNQKPTREEFEKRIQIVESLIVRGRARTIEEVQRGLELLGRENLSNSVCHKYWQIARARLTDATDEMKEARREMVLQSMISTRDSIKKALIDHNVKPTWSDLISMERLLRDVYLTPEEPVTRREPETTDEEHQRNRDQLDKLMTELIDRSSEVIEEVIPSPSTGSKG